MQAPPIGAHSLQLGLQQYSFSPQTRFPHGLPGSGSHSSSRQRLPIGAHWLHRSLQQYSPGPQTALPHGCGAHFTLRHGTLTGRQMPPQRGQQ